MEKRSTHLTEFDAYTLTTITGYLTSTKS